MNGASVKLLERTPGFPDGSGVQSITFDVRNTAVGKLIQRTNFSQLAANFGVICQKKFVRLGGANADRKLIDRKIRRENNATTHNGFIEAIHEGWAGCY